MMCCTRRKKEFIFEHGTRVLAVDYPSAIVKLNEIKLNKFTIENNGNYTWTCRFSSGVSVEYKSPSEHMAYMEGPWNAYLDKKNIN
jgi:hypothetical protein